MAHTSIAIRRRAFLRHVEITERLERTDANRSFYDRLWRRSRFIGPHRFNTWPLVCGLLGGAADRLEIGPGLRPRLPVAGTHFLDISAVAVRQLALRGGLASLGDACRVPYPARSFDLVCALDIVEHLADEGEAFGEFRRIMRPGGVLLLAVPLHPERWTTFDSIVGHARRYTREQLLAALHKGGLTVERSAPYGMQSSSRRLCDLAALGFWRCPRFTIGLYNTLIMPVGLLRQKPLQFSRGLIDTYGVDEVLLVCRRGSDAAQEAD